MRTLTRDAKKRWGTLGYATAGLRAFGRLTPFSAQVIEGGVTHRSRAVHVAVGNARHYGGMTVSEDASIDDGRLDLYSLEVEIFGAWSELRRRCAAGGTTPGRKSALIRAMRSRSVPVGRDQ